MEIYRLKSKNSHLDGFSISLSQEEAHRIITSLSEQMRYNSPNKGREEFSYPITFISGKRKDNLNYFSIYVDPTPPNLPLKSEEDVEELIKTLNPETPTFPIVIQKLPRGLIYHSPKLEKLVTKVMDKHFRSLISKMKKKKGGTK